MSRPVLDRLLQTPAVILRRTETAVDEYGNPEPVWADDVEIRVLLQQRIAREGDGGATETTVWVVYLPPEIEMDGWDRIRVDGEEWTLDGDGAPRQTAIDGLIHHREVRVRRVR